MGQLGQFIVNHWGLWLALMAVLLLLFVHEARSQKQRANEVSPQAAVSLINHEQAAVFDLRDAASFNKGHILNALHISPKAFEEPNMERYKDKPLLLVCERGLQSAKCASLLHTKGYLKPMVLAGGMTAWQTAGLPISQGKKNVYSIGDNR